MAGHIPEDKLILLLQGVNLAIKHATVQACSMAKDDNWLPLGPMNFVVDVP